MTNSKQDTIFVLGAIAALAVIALALNTNVVLGIAFFVAGVWSLRLVLKNPEQKEDEVFLGNMAQKQADHLSKQVYPGLRVGHTPRNAFGQKIHPKAGKPELFPVFIPESDRRVMN